MTTAINVKKSFRIGFDLETMTFQENIVDIHPDSNFKTFCHFIDADVMDVVEYNEEIDIVIDDEGLFISNNPIIEIKTKYGNQQLAGKLLFLKKKFTNDGIDLVGLEAGELFNLLLQLNGKLKAIGKTT